MNLNGFCADGNDVRDYLRAPFNYEGYTYASNGYAIVRVPLLPEYLTNDKIKPGKLFDANAGHDLQPLPVYEKPELKPCKTCEGTGKISLCPECDGNGELEVSSDYSEYTVQCKSCDGDGTATGDSKVCDRCQGSGKEKKIPIKVGSVYIALDYLELIETLPNLRMDCTITDNFSPVPFAFDGGEGLIMQMRAPLLAADVD